MDEESSSSPWTQLIADRRDNPNFRSRTCRIYNRRSKQPSSHPKQQCPCGRLIGRHSLDGTCLESQALDQGKTWICPEKFDENEIHSCAVTVNLFGSLEPRNCKFLRMDSRFNAPNLTELHHLYLLLLEDCAGKKPDMILTISGGAKYFTLTEQLQTEVIRGLIDIAARTDAWILTDGITNGMSKVVGEGILRYRLLHESSDKIKCIGLTMWGTISEKMRLILKKATREYPEELLHSQIPAEQQEGEDAVELNHTHCILFDSGRLNGRLSDFHRDKFVAAACQNIGPTCYAITIMFGGDLNDLQILENDIINKRPVVLIQGSGRLADMLSAIFDLTSSGAWDEHWNPTEREIRSAFDAFFPSYTDQEATASLKQIKSIVDKKHRYLFSVCSLEHGSNVVETIFNAILSAKKIGKTTDDDIDQPSDSPEVMRCLHENKLVDLAFDWNYIDGATPILQRWQDEMLNQKSDTIEKHRTRDDELFKKCLEHDRPTFIDFFLSAGFDPLELTKTRRASECEQFIWDLYDRTRQLTNESHRNRIVTLFGSRLPRSKEQLRRKLQKFVGLFVSSLDAQSNNKFEGYICIDFSKCRRQYHRCHQDPVDQLDLSDGDVPEENQRNVGKEYSKDQMLRDLFLWAVFMDMHDMAKVFLVQLQSRLCAALIGAAIFKQYAKLSATIDLEEKLRAQALDFDAYAASCIDHCYRYDRRTACELLFRQIPLFGNVTCMQVAIASKSEKVLQTACFDQALNLVWYSQLALSNSQCRMILSLLLSATFFGLPAPIVMNYRKLEKQSGTEGNINLHLSSQGINYYVNEESSGKWSISKYCWRFRYFHESPMVKMCYDFVSYGWFLLVFSYMMLYRFDNNETFQTHWTEIYVIITVTTMLCEEVRATVHAYNTQMLELSALSGSTIQGWIVKTFTISPYLLFYFGLILRFCSRGNEDVFTTARIILAFDLEIWYLQSLKFAMALKFLGPQLVMLKNMLRDLFAFVYIIFVAIAAYGVASRSLLFYKQVPFTFRGILRDIFYNSYWFLYAEVSDKDEIDARAQNGTNKFVAEATATEILLSLHMLFINILLLNLLVAVFADTIGKVQQNTEFYWRYQRYSFVREYFQRPILTYPPLSIIPHLILLGCAIRRKIYFRLGSDGIGYGGGASLLKSSVPIFKMISVKESSLDERWNMFENAATYRYGRSILDKEKKIKTWNTNSNFRGKMTTASNSDLQPLEDRNEVLTPTKDDPQTTASVTEELNMLKSAVIDVQQDLSKVIASQQWLMETISRFRSHDSENSSNKEPM